VADDMRDLGDESQTYLHTNRLAVVERIETERR
jgi:hypothetical protein